MKIIETYICLIPFVNNFVKVHLVRDENGNPMYFMETEKSIDEIGEGYFQSIRTLK